MAEQRERQTHSSAEETGAAASSTRRVLLALGFAVIFCSFVLVSPLIVDRIRHDLKLAGMALAWRRISHPPGTTPIADERRVGLLWGNGNHCDYFVGELRTYKGGREAILQHYDGKTVDGGYVRVVFVEDGEFGEMDRWAMPYGLRTLSDWGSTLPDDASLYIAFASDILDDPGFDFRCH